METTNVIKVRFIRAETFTASGREYTYRTPEPVESGDVVDVETANGIVTAQVTQTNIPEEEILQCGDRAKFIIGKTACRCEECIRLTPPDRHGNQMCRAAGHKWPLVGGCSTPVYLWCKGIHFRRDTSAETAIPPASGAAEYHDGQQVLSMPGRTPWG